jgi:hypothetical protein
MHIEQVQGPGISLLQTIVHFPTVPTDDSWWRSYHRRVAATTGLDAVSTAYRLLVRSDGNVERFVSSVFERSKERPARHLFGGMAFLEGLEEDSVALPNDSAEFESWASDLPKLQYRFMPPKLRVDGDIWLSCDFRIADHFDALIREAQSFGFVFGYQAHFRPFSPNPERQRRVGRNLIALKATSTPRDVLDDQERQCARFRAATLLVEETIATDTPESAKWLAAAIGRAFDAAPGRARARLPPPKFHDGGDDVAMMMHSSLLYDDWTEDDLLCSQAEDERFRIRVLSYRPATDRLPPRRRRGPPPDPPNTPFPPNLPLFDGPGHIFISYRRLDLPQITPILQHLAERQFPIWYDRGISGGEEWDAVLERKITESGMMLFFLSQAAADSKYCRREVRLADALNKPLLVVVLETAKLPDGIRFLSLLQQISARDPEFDTLLRRSIERIFTVSPGTSS